MKKSEEEVVHAITLGAGNITHCGLQIYLKLSSGGKYEKYPKFSLDSEKVTCEKCIKKPWSKNYGAF